MALPQGTFPILSFEQNNPLLTGIQKGLSMGYGARGSENELRTNAFKRALLEKYGAQQEEQDIEKNELANALAKINLEYAPQEAETGLAYKQAQVPLMEQQARMMEFKRQHPLWGAGGLAGQIGAAEFGGQLPNGQSNQDILQQHILNTLEKEKNLGSLYGKRNASFEWDKLPKDRQDEILGKFDNAGIPADVANRRLRAGEDVEDVAQDFGISPEEFEKIPAKYAPTQVSKNQTQKMMIASAEADVLSPFMTKAFGRYPESIEGYSPSQTWDQMMGLNDEAQQDYYAAVSLSADYALVRARKANLTPGVRAVSELRETANLKKDYIRARMKPENFIRGQQKADEILSQMNRAGQDAVLNQQSTYKKPTAPQNSEFSKVANGEITPEIISGMAREQNKSESQIRKDLGLPEFYSTKLGRPVTAADIRESAKAKGVSEEQVKKDFGIR